MSLQNGNINSIRRYLLGDLSEQERDHLEQRLMSDDALYEQLLFAEDDLVDEYIFGTLAEEDRAKFKERFLHVPELRQSVSVTAALRKHALETAPQVVVEEEPAPIRPSLLDQLRKFFMQPAIGVAFATVLLGAIGLNLWLFRQNSQLKNRVGELEAQQSTKPRPDLEEQLRLAEERNRLLSEELQRQQSPKPQLVQDQPKVQTPSGTFVVALISGTVRDSGEETKRVTWPANTGKVRFKLDVAPREYRSYRAVLQTPEGQRKLSNNNLKIATGNFVPFEVPVTVLIPGEYQIVLTGIKSSGPREEVGNYYFRVPK